MVRKTPKVDRSVSTGSLVMVGETFKRCLRSDHTVNSQQHAISGGYNLRRRSNHTVNSQQHALSGTLPKIPKLQGISVKAQGQTLSGSLVMLGKTPKLQVELPLHLVVYEILTRLPVKTLSRFRCVSKTLCSFISRPHFQNVHARRSQQTPLLLFATADTTGVHISTHTIHGEQLLKDFFVNVRGPRTPHPYRFDLVQSCLGLVCLRIDCNGALLIFNPSTAEVITLPERPDQFLDLRVGFGYTDFSDEFKVVRIFTRHNKVCISEVFTLGSSDGWRETRSPPPFMPCMTGHLPLVHGALHYLPSIYYHEDMRDDHYISAFDLSTEQYRGIPLPEIYVGFENTNNFFQCEMAELRGSLCMSFDFFQSKKFMQLWFLKDYHGGKWVKEYNIKLSNQPELFYAFSFTGDNHVLLSTQSSKNDRELCYYNAQKKCATKTLGRDSSAMFYVDSFLPLPHGNRHGYELRVPGREDFRPVPPPSPLTLQVDSLLKKLRLSVPSEENLNKFPPNTKARSEEGWDGYSPKKMDGTWDRTDCAGLGMSDVPWQISLKNGLRKLNHCKLTRDVPWQISLKNGLRKLNHCKLTREMNTRLA